MTWPAAGVELGSTPGGGPTSGIPWYGVPRPAYPLENTMPDRKATATDPNPGNAQRATDATVDDRAAKPAQDTDVATAPVEQDSHEDLVNRVRRLEEHIL